MKHFKGRTTLTLRLLVANFTIQNDATKLKKTETLAMGTHLRVLCEGYLMSTKTTRFRWFSKSFVWTQLALALEGLRFLLVGPRCSLISSLRLP